MMKIEADSNSKPLSLYQTYLIPDYQRLVPRFYFLGVISLYPLQVLSTKANTILGTAKVI